MILQDFDQDEDCSHSILVTEGGDPSGDGQDWQSGTEGIWAIICVIVYTDYLDSTLLPPRHPNFSSLGREL